MKDNARVRSEIIRTDDFFVEKRIEKKMNLLRKSDLIFEKIARMIDNNESGRQQFREERAQNQREDRLAKRLEKKINRRGYFRFKLDENFYEYEIIEKEMKPFELKLEDGEYFLLSNTMVGFYRGSINDLEKYLDSFYI